MRQVTSHQFSKKNLYSINPLILLMNINLENDFKICSKCYCMSNTSLCKVCRKCGSELNED